MEVEPSTFNELYSTYDVLSSKKYDVSKRLSIGLRFTPSLRCDCEELAANIDRLSPILAQYIEEEKLKELDYSEADIAVMIRLLVHHYSLPKLKLTLLWLFSRAFNLIKLLLNEINRLRIALEESNKECLRLENDNHSLSDELNKSYERIEVLEVELKDLKKLRPLHERDPDLFEACVNNLFPFAPDSSQVCVRDIFKSFPEGSKFVDLEELILSSDDPVEILNDYFCGPCTARSRLVAQNILLELYDSKNSSLLPEMFPDKFGGFDFVWENCAIMTVSPEGNIFFISLTLSDGIPTEFSGLWRTCGTDILKFLSENMNIKG